MKKILYSSILITSLLLLFSCGDGSTNENTTEPTEDPVVTLDESSRADNGGSGVMLQGFTWSSPHLAGDWYSTVTENADEIKDLFEYVWFPPVSDCTDTTGNGYLPRQLNMLTQSTPDTVPYYGSEADLREAVSSIKPAKAIADIVINHRCGTTSWGDFTNPSWDEDFYSICKDDEGFSNKNSGMYGTRKKGAADTGESYSSGRDIDHTNTKVQDGIAAWMNDVLKDVGFVGWRYDYVKGYAGNYVGLYNNKSQSEFSVGEYWPTAGFYSGSAVWTNLITNWITETAQYTNGTAGKPSRAFDYVLKGMLNEVFGSGNQSSDSAGEGSGDYSKLASEYNLYKKLPGYTVTFVDNHDTGSTQSHWYLNPDKIASAYAFILTHPGYPCVAWYHYFAGTDCASDSQTQYIGGNTVPGSSLSYKELITSLVNLRKNLGINDMSDVSVVQADTTRYAAEVTGTNGNVYIVIGATLEAIPAGYTETCSGTGFSVYTK